MMKQLTVFFLCASAILLAQKKKKFDMDVVSNIEAKAIVMKPFGHNTYAKDLETFYGFGFGGNLMTPLNFGIGIEYNLLLSNVKLGHENKYGSISSPKIHNFDFFLTHRDQLSEDFSIEEMVGYSYYLMSNVYTYDQNQNSRISGSGLNLGGKFLYTLDREGIQQFYFSAKVNFYYSGVFNENTDIQNYYNRSIFVSGGIGYRYNF